MCIRDRSAGEASLTFSLIVRPDVSMHAFHGLPFVAAMGMMDALVGTASTPGLGLAGKVGIEWPSNIVYLSLIHISFYPQLSVPAPWLGYVVYAAWMVLPCVLHAIDEKRFG